MFGAICGDIIGSVFEWHNVKTKDFELFGRDSRFTDDTVMTVAVADALLSASRRAAPSTAKLYAAKFRQYHARHPNAGFGQMFADWAKSDRLNRQRSYGNGAAMRACPIGYAFDTLEDVLVQAKLSCAYTHRHPEAIRGARAVAGAVFLAHHGAKKQEIAAFVGKTGLKIDFTLDAIREGYVFDSRTRYSVPPAIVAFLESDSYESAVRKAISIGGDSDTIACIAGGIAEAHYREIPDAIRNRCLGLLDTGFRQVIRNFYATFIPDSPIFDFSDRNAYIADE